MISNAETDLGKRESVLYQAEQVIVARSLL